LNLETKSFAISKGAVYDAFKRVKANRGSAGTDHETLEGFEENLSGNLYKIWNRMSSGSYFPPAVKEVEIPKKSGGVRKLGIPTVSDRVAQTVVKMYLESLLEPHFVDDSYGYRPKKSAIDAVAVTRKRCWKYDWVVEFDIKGAFDHLRHDLLRKALRKHTNCRWVLLYIDRWLVAPSVSSDREIIERDCGTPQGGVISPLLMNLFMHYAFDLWMQREIAACPFARYADDAVVHCRTEHEARLVLQKIQERFAELGLQTHPDKTRIVYCKDSNRTGNYRNIQFTFLGYTFRPRCAANRRGEIFTSFLPAVSGEAKTRMRQQIKSWRIPRQTPGTLEEFSRAYNRKLIGWWHYYGRFYPTEMNNVFNYVDLTLARWARRKYKRMARHKRRSYNFVLNYSRRSSSLFIHWSLRNGNDRTMGAQ